MALKKCPRCELNYILDDGALCSVCYEEVHGSKKAEEEETHLCSVCGEKDALPGEDMCAGCLRELRRMGGPAAVDTDVEEDDEENPAEIEEETAISELEDLPIIDEDDLEEPDEEFAKELMEEDGSEEDEENIYQDDYATAQ